MRNEVRLDICPRAFWEVGQAAFFDGRVFNSNALIYTKLEPSKSLKINLKEKKYYNERIM